jgi:hypothetical protein
VLDLAVERLLENKQIYFFVKRPSQTWS